MIVFDLTQVPPAPLKRFDFGVLGERLGKALRLRRMMRVGVRFVSEAEIQRLNNTYRQKNRPTDVLSFEPSADMAGQEKDWLGDIVLCAVYAKREAKRRSIAWEEELVRLLVHGVLHLSGYDHATEPDEAKMFALQERVVEATCHPV